MNADVAAGLGEAAERLGSLDRVTAERHGAIRVGTPGELAQVARIFAATGMHPTGFYDLRDASASSVPVVSTAFRPIESDELAANPFRVFTSLLATTDRRFFTADLSARLQNFLAGRELFAPRLLTLADRARADGSLSDGDADGVIREGSLRVRFGEVEAREIALTRQGRARYDQAVVEADSAGAGGAAAVWARHFPRSEADLFASGLGVYTVRAVTDRPGNGGRPHGSVGDLIRTGWLETDPVVYEDFLPRSAAGIFQSNLTDAGSKDAAAEGADLDAPWLEGVLNLPLNDPFDLYEGQRRTSIDSALRHLGVPAIPEPVNA